MSIAKVTEVISSSTVSMEDAVKSGIERASKTIEGISGVWVKDTKATIKNNKIEEWRLTLAITFVLND
ncbi:dodecin family protein [Parasphingorhabdus sp.]|uniref:dodecin family protein n=1 Tax=Parasphingorhabdus sp. TaxID=2709688 RepID=UPI002F95C89F